jgi:hypothetical protein
MHDFGLYFDLGTDHILTWQAMDHILFVTALCLRYQWQDWQKVAILVTAFTIGHSATLALSAFSLIRFPRLWIEFLIPLTIAATALNNIAQINSGPRKKLPVIYFFALFFGLIHGLAYASSFLDLEGKEGLVAHLFAFNAGIELAQLLVVGAVLFISFILVQLLKIPGLWWMRVASILILAVSVNMAIDRLPNTKNQTNEKTSLAPSGANAVVWRLTGAKHAKQPRFQPRQQV